MYRCYEKGYAYEDGSAVAAGPEEEAQLPCEGAIPASLEPPLNGLGHQIKFTTRHLPA
ncbi:hypothetical protein FHS19_005938 [Paenibacillus rhizosphaerae]|uniref:Uncharacterized protein n=1 Tax=Paenibacillus rhizosphaerae TaxID=297318 RepID=A0A839U0Q2_9BACL|nr:hypothetical protein [Paenibacillus rhizosphaerae]MBB3131218.1 hypothetical protein [Paenibacillus rhizosphaerae]